MLKLQGPGTLVEHGEAWRILADRGTRGFTWHPMDATKHMGGHQACLWGAAGNFYLLSLCVARSTSLSRESGSGVAISFWVHSREEHNILGQLVPTTRNGKGKELDGVLCCSYPPLAHSEHKQRMVDWFWPRSVPSLASVVLTWSRSVGSIMVWWYCQRT